MSGLVVRTCRHLIHYDCLNSYKIQNSANRAHTLLIEDFNLNEFSCPLCKHYSNTIIPPNKEVRNLVETSTLKSLPKDQKNEVLAMLLDFINIANEKHQEDRKKDILIVDIKDKKPQIVETITNLINHCVQLTDVKSLSWILSEAPKLRSILLLGRAMIAPENTKKLVDLNLPDINISECSIFKANIPSMIIQSVLCLYYRKVSEEKKLDFDKVSSLLKLGYALTLYQISAAIIYEKNGYRIEDQSTTLSIESIRQMVKSMDAKLTVAGQSIETESRFIEGSLSYLRKATAIIYLVSDSTHGKSIFNIYRAS